MKTYTSPVMLAATLLVSSITLHAQSPLVASGDFAPGQTWAGYSWDAWRPVIEEAFTNQLTEPGQSAATEVYFHPLLPSFQVHSDWQGTFDVSATASASNASGVGSSSVYHFNAISDAGVRALTGTTHGGSQQFFTDGGSSTVTYDFGGLTNGYLPAGTMLWLSDMDAYPAAAQNEGPLSITGDSMDPFLELIWQGNLADSGSTTIPPRIYFDDAGNYTVDNTNSVFFNNPNDLSVFYTTRDLTSLSISSKSASSASHSVFIYAPIVPIPEPSGVLLIGLTGTLALLRRRRHG